MELPKVTVCGIGGTGLALAADTAFTGAKVNLFALDRSKEKIRALEEKGGIDLTGAESISGKMGFAPINKATTNPQEAIEDSKLIMIAVPATAHENFLKALLPHLEEDQILLFNTGYFASLRFEKLLRSKGFFNKITIADGDIGPYVVRRTSPTSTHIYRYKRKLALATFPGNKTGNILETVRLFLPQYRREPNVFWTNFNSGNPPVHPTLTIPIAGIFERFGACNFYREATVRGGRLVEAFDNERQKVGETLGCKIQRAIDWFKDTYGYEGDEISSLLRRSVHAEAHTTDEHSTALITEDVAYFYIPMIELGKVAGIPTPVTEMITQIIGIMLDTNFWDKGIKLKDLGLEDLSIKEMMQYVNTGQK